MTPTYKKRVSITFYTKEQKKKLTLQLAYPTLKQLLEKNVL